jgi:hypothetical protein
MHAKLIFSLLGESKFDWTQQETAPDDASQRMCNRVDRAGREGRGRRMEDERDEEEEDKRDEEEEDERDEEEEDERDEDEESDEEEEEVGVIQLLRF